MNNSTLICKVMQDLLTKFISLFVNITLYYMMKKINEQLLIIKTKEKVSM